LDFENLQESIERFEQKMAVELEKTVQEIDRALQAGHQAHRSQAESQQAVVAERIAYPAQLRQIRQDITRKVVSDDFPQHLV